MRLLSVLAFFVTFCHGRRQQLATYYGKANEGSHVSVGVSDETDASCKLTQLASLLLALHPGASFSPPNTRFGVQQKTLAMRTPTNIPVLLTSESSRVSVVRMEDTPSPEPIIKDAVAKFKKTIETVNDNLATLRTGRATPSLLDRVEVNYYGAPTPLNQLASVTAPTASQLVVDVYDKSAMGDVEKALFESDLGMTPSNDGKVIRLNVPSLTEDRRKEMVKTAKSLGEDGKVAIRNVRKTALDKIKKMKKTIGEDAIRDAEESVQKAVKKYEEEVAGLVAKREKEIMTI